MIELNEELAGGQALRAALTFSLVTGHPFTATNFRAARPSAGLRPQHLACLRGAEALSQGRSEGAEVGSSRFSFHPGKVAAGDYLLDVGTAGSAALVFQSLFYPLALAGGGELTLRGGTHVPKSPSYHYLTWVWQPAVRAYGLDLELHLRKAGFQPEGGGEFRARILPRRPPPERVILPARGTLREMAVTSFVSGLSFDVAERQGQAAATTLREHGILCEAEKIPLPSRSSGFLAMVRAEFEYTVAAFTALGERSSDPEAVGREVAREAVAFMTSSGALDRYLADQILIPAALLAAGALGEGVRGETLFTTAALTPQLTAHARVAEHFLPIAVELEEGGQVRVKPRADGEVVR